MKVLIILYTYVCSLILLEDSDKGDDGSSYVAKNITENTGR